MHRFSKSNLFLYEGPSMYPTFRTGDGLCVVPYNNRRINTGDVVIFESPENKRRIVHRVIAVLAEGIRTRGDHNRHIDPYLLRPDQIIGKVVTFQRGKRQHKALNGFFGLFYQALISLCFLMIRAFIIVLYPLYRFLYRTKLLAKIFPVHFNTTLVSFQKNGVVEYQLLWHKHVIGRRPATHPTWSLDRFFRLWLDEKTLP
jgi:signal peptidase I